LFSLSYPLSQILPLPFIGSGLLFSAEQVRASIGVGALGVAVLRPELWLYRAKLLSLVLYEGDKTFCSKFSCLM